MVSIEVLNGDYLRKIGDWLKLVRIGNGFVIGFSAIVGYVVSDGRVLGDTMLLFLSAMLIGCYGNIVNDIFDIDIDRINKPWRPLPSKRTSMEIDWSLALILAGLGTLLSFFINILCFITAISAVALLYLYSNEIKRPGFAGNSLIAFLSFLVIVYGGFAAPLFWKSFISGLYAFMIIIGREVLKSLEDIEDDRRYRVSTIAVKLGIRKALIIGMIFLMLVVIISPIPYFYMDMNLYYLATAILGVDIPILIAPKMVFADPVGTHGMQLVS